MSIVQPARLRHRGGNCVEDVRITASRGHGHDLEFNGHAGAAVQVCRCDRSYQSMTAEDFGLQRLCSSRPAPMPKVRELLGVLERVLTLPRQPHVDFAIALDWYKIPNPNLPASEWSNTDLADLVRRGKYWYRDKADYQRQRSCGLALVDHLIDLINRHPLLRRVDSVATVPGHDPKIRGFGARLSTATGRALGLEIVQCAGPDTFRAEAKNLPKAQLAKTITNTFSCSADLRGQVVLVIDDVYHTGTTMNETARALKLAGATAVAGLCPVRTMRST